VRPRAVLLAFALASTLAASQAEARSFAIIIGNNASPPKDPSLAALRFADDDAVRYLKLFERITDETHLLTVLDAQSQKKHPGLAARSLPPTLAQLRQTLARIEAQMRTEPGTVYFVFSGHGSENAQGEPYLALLDQGLSQKMLYEEVLAKLPAKRVHLIVDACNAGAMVGAKGAFDREIDAQVKTVSPSTQRAVLQQGALTRFPHVGAIIATSAGQESHEWSRIESGVFTHELLSGAVGAADINADLKIEYSELQAFIASANSRVSDPRARPSVIAMPPAADHRAPLLSLATLDGPFLRGDAAQLAKFHIELEGGQRYVDAHLAGQGGFTILLPHDTAGYVRTEDSEAALPATRDGVLQLDDLSFRTVRLASRGSLDDALRQQLFVEPFDVAYYRGYVDSRALVSADLGVQAVVPLSERWTWKEKAAVGLFATAGAAAVSSVITGTFALRTKKQHDETTIQRTATELAARYDRLLVATWVGAALSAATAGAGTWLWVSAQPDSANDEQNMLVGLAGSF